MSRRTRLKQLPSGRYRTRLIGKESHKDADSGRHVTLTFEVILGDYTGMVIRQNFWSRILLERVAALSRGRIVDILVTQKRTAKGYEVPVVSDFIATGDRTAPEVVSGIPENPAAAEEKAAQAVQPKAMLVSSEYEWLLREADEDSVLPLLIDDSLWSRLVEAVGPDAPPIKVTPRPIGSDGVELDQISHDLDEASEDHSWVLVAERDADTLPACESWESFYARQEIVEPGVVPATDLRVSAYEYTNDMRTYHAAHKGCMTRHSGLAWARWLTVRLVGVSSIESALEPARRLAVALERSGVSREQIVVILEANHQAVRIHIPSSCAEAYPQLGFECVSGHFWQLFANVALMPASHFKKGFFFMVPVDPLWHTPISRRHFRPQGMLTAVNSQDPESGLFVVAVTPEELQKLRPYDVRRLSRRPRPFTWPSWRAAPIELLSDCWDYAVEVERSRTTRFATPAPDEAWIYADTFRFVHAGAPGRDSEVACIRAALNLFQFGAPAALVLALLGPGASLSGLCQEQTRRLIQWAVTKHLGKGGTIPDVDADGDWGD
jgi:hypothetical protein